MPSALAAFLGIDVGTTAVKAVLVGEDGVLLAEAETEQEVSMPRPAWVEQDPRLWWASTTDSVSSVLEKASWLRNAVEVRAIGLSGQMHSSVFMDGSGEIIRPVLL